MTETPRYDIEVTRVIDAPPERVYQAFTDPGQFAGTNCSRAADRGTGFLVTPAAGRRAFGSSSTPKLESLLTG